MSSISRGETWLALLSQNAPRLEGLCPSVQVADADLNGENVRYIAVVPDENNHFPRAANGEVGLLEGWTLAKVVQETIAADAQAERKRPIVAVIDVPSGPTDAAKKPSASIRRWRPRPPPGAGASRRAPDCRADRRQGYVRRFHGARLSGQPADRL